MAAPTDIPAHSVGGLPFSSQPVQNLLFCRLFNDGHSDRCEVIPHCSSDFHFWCCANLPANAGDAGDVGLTPGLGRCPEVGNGNPLQYCWMESSMDRGAWQATAHGVQRVMTWLSNWVCTRVHTHTYSNQPCWVSFHVPIGHLHIFLRNAYLGLLYSFQLGCLFFVVELNELLIYFGN